MEPISPRVPAHPHLPNFEGENPWSRCQRSSPGAFWVSPVRIKDDRSNHLEEIYTNRLEIPSWSDARAQGERTLGSTWPEVSPWPKISLKGGRVWISP